MSEFKTQISKERMEEIFTKIKELIQPLFEQDKEFIAERVFNELIKTNFFKNNLEIFSAGFLAMGHLHFLNDQKNLKALTKTIETIKEDLAFAGLEEKVHKT